MVANDVVSATYSYLALSALAEQIDFRRAGLDRMITRRTYDNLNRLAEVFSLSTRAGVFSFATPLQSFVWGTDASGSMQGAGGVGGLLATRVHTGPNAGTYFYCYDGNWNVVGLVNALSGSVAARYEYGPFHELIRASGPMASENHFQAATKYRDSETGLYYYGYRYYNPGTGRWLSRDPIGEKGGVNLYGIVFNRPLNGVDTDGRQSFPINYENPKMPRTLSEGLLLSFLDNIGLPVNHIDETKWFLEYDTRAKQATSKANAFFERRINKRLCERTSKLVYSRFVVAPDSELHPVGANHRMKQDPMERSVILGWYEYRLTRLSISREGSGVHWKAEISIIDKMGWERDRYKQTFAKAFDDPWMIGFTWGYGMLFETEAAREQFSNDYNNIATVLFGAGNREFIRGTYQITGKTDCCAMIGHQ